MSQDDNPRFLATSLAAEDWHELARKASKEFDGKKLSELVQDLLDSIDRDLAKKHPTSPRKPDPSPDGNPQAR